MLIEEQLTEQIIGGMIEVHTQLGPGLLESAYEECLCHELKLRGLKSGGRSLSQLCTRESNSIAVIEWTSLWKKKLSSRTRRLKSC